MSASVNENKSATISLPPSALLPCPRRHILCIDVFSWHAVTAILFVTTICAFNRLYVWYQEPWRRRRRFARKQLRQWLRLHSNGLPSNLTALLQQAFDQPDSANLLQLADAVQSKHPQLADSLRQFEHARFSSGSSTEQAISELRKHLRRAVMVALLLCLAACSNQFISCWHEATRLAENGRLQESLEIFTELSKTHSTWQLSNNIAVLHTYLNAPQEASIWGIHRTVQRQAYGIDRPWFIHFTAELLLPTIVALLCAACFNRGARRLSLVMVAVITIVLFVAAIRPRIQLSRKAVITVRTTLVPIPSDSTSPVISLVELSEGSVVRILSKESVNDCIQIKSDKISGWIPRRNALFFTSP